MTARLPRRKWVHPLRGRTIKEALAKAIEAKLGKPLDSSTFQHNHPYEIKYDGRCSWAASAYHTARWNLHSWDPMSDCLKYGFDISEENGEISAKDNDWHQRELLGGQNANS